MQGNITLILLGSLLGLGTLPVYAADEVQPTTERVEARERVYGWELMDEAERAEYRERMRNMHTEQEREEFRQQHHEEMQERAREEGVELSDTPMGPGYPGGMGPGGMGGGMGGGGRAR